MEDIYWTHGCLNALKHRDKNTFNLCISYINNPQRRNRLMTIFRAIMNRDEEMIGMLSKYSCPVMIHIS